MTTTWTNSSHGLLSSKQSSYEGSPPFGYASGNNFSVMHRPWETATYLPHETFDSPSVWLLWHTW